MPWPQTGENHYYAELGPQEICRAMQELLGSMAMIYDKRKVRSLVRCCGQDGNRAQVP